MSVNPSPLSSLTSSSGSVMPQGGEVASFATYPEAQEAVDAPSDQGFPVQHLTIIGTGLRQVERITGHVGWGRAATSRAFDGLWIGVSLGVIMSVAGNSGPRPNFWAYVLLGALWGAVFQLFSYALTRGWHDSASVSQIVASCYSILAAREIYEASQALVDIPDNLARGADALRRSQEWRRARQEVPGPAASGSRPDEQPRLGVRLSQPGSDTPERTPAASAGSASGAPFIAEDYDPFSRPSQSEGRKEPGAPASSQEPGDETGSGDKGRAVLRDEGARQ